MRGVASFDPRYLGARLNCFGDDSRDGVEVVAVCRRSTPGRTMRCSSSAKTVPEPHVTITFYDDVDTGVARLLVVSHLSNPAFRQEDA